MQYYRVRYQGAEHHVIASTSAAAICDLAIRLNNSEVGNSAIIVPAKIVIKRSRETGEYRVPGPAGTEAQAYYTDDMTDALATLRSIYGDFPEVTFRDVK